ncbi:MAG TPA: hypothetical protein VFE50_21940 [Cyclobacteriaceae bacterium]|nr:hypothetical protein [Cyclobacteriaceae bacterium]
MQNTERQKFEENWKSAFDGAEMTPSDNVWNSIELDLAGQESATMKKRVVFYQRLAAATVIFALLTGTYAFYTNYNRTEVKETASKQVEKKVEEKNSAEPPKEDVIQKETPVASPAPQVAIAEKEEGPTATVVEEAPEPVIAAEITPAPETGIVQEETKKEEAVVSPLLQTAPLTASLEEQKQPEEVIEKKNTSRERTWLALGAAAGNYSPNMGGGGGGGGLLFSSKSQADFQSTNYSAIPGPTLNNVEAAAQNSNRTKVGTSYTLGVGVGKKFGRFVIQSGVNLGKQQIDYTSTYDTRLSNNSIKASAAFYNSLSNTFSTTPYTINSSMDIISIPVQAGYMIVDRRLGWQMNAGFSPDFFLRNTLVDKSGQRQKFSQGAGDDSPYRSVNWSGLMNTELSYRIGDHYRISFVPGMRYSFTSILKDDKTSKPLILDVGFRFRYMFD